MITYSHSTHADLCSETLYRAMIDIARWPQWDLTLSETAHDGSLEVGSFFTIKPKGRPRLELEIVEASAPAAFVTLARLPLGRIRMRHDFTPQASGGSTVGLRIEVVGPLAWLWDRLVARKLAAGAAEQARAFIAFASG